MEPSIEQQILEQFKKAGKILIVLPENLNVDALSAGLALRLFLLKQQKEVSIASSSLVPLQLRFLPGAETVQNRLTQGKSLVVSINTTVKKLEEISYQKTPQAVQIYLKSQADEFEQQDISFSKETAPLDLIVALGGKSLESFGKIFEQATDRFFETPKINIDCQAANEYFGAINLVDITATSVSEILVELMQKYEEQLIDEDIATCLLSGIIEKTSSFQHVQTTPRAFLKASELVALGGRQQEVVKNIFKTKSLPLLKLWGRALARLKLIENLPVVYAPLGLMDFEKAEAGSAEIFPALKELVNNLNGNKIFALIFEIQKNQIDLQMAVHEQIQVEKLLVAFPGATQSAMGIGDLRLLEYRFAEQSLEEAEKFFEQAIKTAIA
ncbi:MAG: hypothetical protein WC794_02745 [Candidatus Doudnabacteria bacterium]|jgi:nanoRNase/pAp phosphatase (c-di-AMP/oligoRNAs hydrolase)